jgi:hypothetical protein
MSGRVGVDAERLLGIVRAVVEQPGAKGQGRPLVLDVQLRCRRHGQVQMELLWDRALRPRSRMIRWSISLVVGLAAAVVRAVLALLGGHGAEEVSRIVAPSLGGAFCWD